MHIARVPKILQPFECEDLIRVGKNNDGGYLVNRYDLDVADVLISLGIGEDISFEKGIHAFGIDKIHAYDIVIDPSIEYFFTEERKLHKQSITKESFEQILKEHNKNIFLKCDIEGAEYSILDVLISNRFRFTGMVIEFHSICNPDNFDKLSNFIAKTNMKLVHIHVNNYFYYINGNQKIPDVVELTFTSLDNIIYNPDLELPHYLDMSNNPDDQQFKLVFS